MTVNCSTCRHSMKAKAEGVVGCRLLNQLTEANTCTPGCEDLVDYDIIRGQLHDGWFMCGSMLARGIVIDKTGLCKHHEMQTHIDTLSAEEQVYYGLAQDLRDCINCIEHPGRREMILNYIGFLQEKAEHLKTKVDRLELRVA